MTSQIWSLIGNGVLETLEMTIVSTILAYIIGVPYGILLKITGKGEILEQKIVNSILALFANIFRSIPFLILLVFLIPFTRAIVGTSIGTEASIVPLTVGAIPIIARMVEQSLNEIPYGITEAAKSMGANSWQIVTEFILPEAMPSLVSGTAINMATVLGYSAMAGCIGGGGLGAIALNYGYYRYQKDVLFITVFILIVIVQIIQESGVFTAKKIRH
ncbi:MAG: ABC transporter permease [Clostridia bacterium]|nr:ABC transporter permease [Clostridia bacterium]